MSEPCDPLSPATPQRMTRMELVALAAIGAVALVLRLVHLTDRSLWLDEIFTIMLAAGHGVGFKDIPVGQLLSHGPDLTGFGDVPLYAIPFHLRGDVHPPLVYLLLRAWIGIGGIGDLSVRLFPVFFSVASCICVYFPARRTVGSPLALLVSAAIACSAFEIYYGQEVRSYSLLQLEMVLALWASLLIVQDGVTPKRLLAWSGLSLALVLTHYFSLGAVVALGLWLLLAAEKPQRLKILAAAGGAALAFLVLWSPFFLQQLHGGGLTGNHMAAKEPITLADVSLRALTFPARTFLPFLQQNSLALAVLGALFLAATCLIATRGPRPSPNRYVLAWWSVLVGSLLMQMALDLSKATITLRFARYSFHVTPAVFVCVAALLIPFTQSLRVRLVPALLALGIAIYVTVRFGYQPKAYWREIAAYFDHVATPQDALVVISEKPNDDRPGMNYMCLSHYSRLAGTVPLLLLDPARPASPEAFAGLARAPHIFVLSPLPPQSGPPNLPNLTPIGARQFPYTTGDATQTVWEFAP